MKYSQKSQNKFKRSPLALAAVMVLSSISKGPTTVAISISLYTAVELSAELATSMGMGCLM